VNDATAVILAGGRSARMGTPKALLDFGGVTLIERIVTELHTGFDRILIVAAPESADPLAGKLARISAVRVLRDEQPFEGPLLALARALDTMETAVAFACGCDAPFIQVKLACDLVAKLDSYDAAIPIVNGRPQPLCAAYRTTAAAALRAMLAQGQRRLTAFTDEPNVHRVSESELRAIDPELRSFVNVNTPADYQRALTAAGLAP
jgi:molybdenum cofactor guanylyltransferase